MPIRPENRKRYPRNWKAISADIRFRRAQNRCECMGECDSLTHLAMVKNQRPEIRCQALNGRAHPVTGSKVVLTVAHLDHTPENCDESNLRAMCQACHLSYDRDHHAETRRARQ